MITQIIGIDDWNFAMDQAQRLSNMHLMQRSWLSYVIYYYLIVFILLSINMHILYLCILNVLLVFVISSFVMSHLAAIVILQLIYFTAAMWLKINYFVIISNISGISKTYNVYSTVLNVINSTLSQWHNFIVISCGHAKK